MPLVEGISYASGADRIRNTGKISRRNSTSFKEYTAPGKKNIPASGRPAVSPGASEFYRYKYNSQVSKLSHTGQIFNKIEKPFNGRDSHSSGGNAARSEDSSPGNYNIYETAVGYYIISKTKLTGTNAKTSGSKNSNPMKKKLEKTYHSNTGNPTGSLVNIVYY